MRLGRNDACWCGSGKKYKNCHINFDQKIEAFRDAGHIVPDHSILKSPEDIQGIKESAKINIACLDYVAEHIKAGVSTLDIDNWVAKITADMGGVSACLNYEGFPKNCCTSINDQVCHGIPSADDILKEGDIVNVDCSTILNGYFSDSSRMFIIGETTPEKKKLVEDVKKSIEIGLKEVKPWKFLGDMGNAINQFCMSQGYSVVREIGGHGCGKEFHEEPWVSFVSKPNTEMLMVPGMCFTIEPMVNLGNPDIYEDEDNGWTIYTEDGSPSAQWEIQLVVTEDGYEIITY
ncbi:MAG: type I methionyl aminopeptidase [Lachnospiraceae bacterium]|nr:type I methionyl aminopeptidase [Lachnospiraceae bacterium]